MIRVGYLAANTPKAESVLLQIASGCSLINVEKEPEAAIDVLLVLGGDGFMLNALHRYMHKGIAIYGINCGTVGFLLNDYQQGSDLMSIIEHAAVSELKILQVKATDLHGSIYNTYAINEASLFRMSHQATFLRVKVNEQICLEKLVGDGIIVSTAAGSSAYNFSAGGSILPIDSALLSVAGINTFRPRRWQSAILPDSVVVGLEVLEPENRPVMLTADCNEFHQIAKVEISVDKNNVIKLLFNSHEQLFARLINEQFFCG